MGGTHVLSCASAWLCLGGMQSHMKEALSLAASLPDSDLMSVSKGPLSPPPAHPLPDTHTLPVSRLALSSKNTHKMQVKTQRCDRKHAGQRTHADVASSHSEPGLSSPKTGRVSADQTNTHNLIILQLHNYYDYRHK